MFRRELLPKFVPLLLQQDSLLVDIDDGGQYPLRLQGEVGRPLALPIMFEGGIGALHLDFQPGELTLQEFERLFSLDGMVFHVLPHIAVDDFVKNHRQQHRI